jgi:TRAP-type C4-dicarboxylate transport system substrate-binding protein
MNISRRWLSAAVCAVSLLAAAAPAAAVVFKIATDAPDGSLWVSSLRSAAEQVAEHTEGRITFKFYPGGVMGDDKAVMRKIRSGQLHGAVMTVGGLTRTYTDIQLYNMPMAFRSLAEVDHVRANMDQALLNGLEEHGFVSFGIAEVGFAYAMTQERIATLEDVRAQKVWVPDGDEGAARSLESFGITPIPLSIADVLGGLQTGLIDSVTVPPVAAIVLQWHTQLDHVLDLPLLYVYGTLAVSERQFNKVSDEDQAYMRQVLGELVREVNTQNRQDHERAVEVLQEQGLAWHAADPVAVAQWQDIADAASLELVEAGIVSAPIYEDMVRLLAEYRDSVD